MDRAQRLGKNIRCIRVAYGESQEKLGEAIGVEKNTVSYYENGKREPNKDILRAIAVHYMVSVEELLTGDFSSLEKITVNQNALWEHIDEVLPVTFSEQAMANPHFKKAYEIHRHFFDLLSRPIWMELTILMCALKSILKLMKTITRKWRQLQIF